MSLPWTLSRCRSSGRSDERLQLYSAVPRQPEPTLDRARSLPKPDLGPQLTGLDTTVSLPLDVFSATGDFQAKDPFSDIVDVFTMATNRPSHDAAAADPLRGWRIVGNRVGDTVLGLQSPDIRCAGAAREEVERA